MSDPFADLLSANAAYAQQFDLGDLQGRAARGLAIVTCMDTRIEPLRMLGLRPGDAKILRNAGGRVTDDVLRTLVLAVHLLGVDRVMVVAHTDCRMAKSSDEEVHGLILRSSGVDTRSLEFRTAPDQDTALRLDVTRIRAHPLLPRGLPAASFLYDVASGRVRTAVAATGGRDVPSDK